MDGPIRDQIRGVYRQLAARHEWQLVDDEARFIEQVATEAQQLDSSDWPEGRLRLAIQRVYSTLLYQGMVARRDRAAQELWQACFRVALGSGVDPQQAQELAQETITRVFAKLSSLRSPQSLITWTLMILRTVQREQRRRLSNVQPFLSEADGEQAQEPVDTADIAAKVEAQVLDAELAARLRAKLPNDLERLTLLRCILLGDDPRDVARDLGLPLYRTRVAKSRALQRLRGDEEFMQFVRALVASPAVSLRSAGAPGEGTDPND